MLSLVLILTVALMVGGSEAITCYNCNSVDTPGCGATITNPAAIPTCSGAWCGIGTTVNTNPTVYVRECGQDTLPAGTNTCASLTVQGIATYDCVCDTNDFCNVASANLPYGASLILATSAAVILLAKL